ncbi:AarF/UbiB family protein [Carnimonas bestiolae]|uniref:AarF/UbiB family protein n=1 Tax=Carnimonas bestiolae TaxID=3402172 RepID=UPI003F4A9442
MTLHTLSLPSGNFRYRMRHVKDLPARIAMMDSDSTRHFAAIGSSYFQLSSDGSMLLKFSRDKYRPQAHFFKWLMRDVISTRWLGSFDSKHEYQSAEVLRSVGQHTVLCHGVGVAAGLSNPLNSVFVMEYMASAVSGRERMAQLAPDEQRIFFDRFMGLVIALAKAGYAHRDLHMGNILVTQDDRLVWIDTHVKRLPRALKKRARVLSRMIDPNKLGGPHYETLARAQLFDALPELADYRPNV